MNSMSSISMSDRPWDVVPVTPPPSNEVPKGQTPPAYSIVDPELMNRVQLTDEEAMQEMARHCPNLRSLDLAFRSELITEKTIQAIADHCHDLFEDMKHALTSKDQVGNSVLDQCNAQDLANIAQAFSKEEPKK